MKHKAAKAPSPFRRKTSFVKGGPNPGFKKRDPDAGAKPLILHDDDGEYTDAELKLACDLAALDLSNATIAQALQMTVAVFAKAQKLNPALANSLAVGRGRAEDRLTRNLQRLGIKNFIPNISMLKARHQYREDDPETDQGTRIQIVFPGALPDSSVVEGQVLPMPDDDDGDTTPLSILTHEQFDDDLREPAPHATEAASSDEPSYSRPAATISAGVPPNGQPFRPQNGAERAALREFEHSVGIKSVNLRRRDFPSEAAWNRYNKSKPS